MPHFRPNAKIHHIRFWLGLCPRPNCGSSQCFPRSLAGFKASYFLGRKEDRGKGKRGRVEKRREDEMREGIRGWKRGNGKERGPPPYFVQGPPAPSS